MLISLYLLERFLATDESRVKRQRGFLGPEPIPNARPLLGVKQTDLPKQRCVRLETEPTKCGPDIVVVNAIMFKGAQSRSAGVPFGGLFTAAKDWNALVIETGEIGVR
jgi:hypothetical protein